MRAAILVASDKGSRGERVDLSGAEINRFLAGLPAEVVVQEIVPDDQTVIAARLTAYRDRGDIDLVLTSGGTGLASRDVTPEATLAVIDRLVPGIPELMRSTGLHKTPLACLSRGIAGTMGRTLVINLPGSPKAVRESLEALLPVLPHAMAILTGEVTEH